MKKEILSEVNEIKKMMGLHEQSRTIPQDTVAIKSSIENFNTNNKAATLIFLTPRDSQCKVIGKKLTYSISGKYSFLPEFDVKIRNIRRDSNGTLFAEAKPINSVVDSAMKAGVGDYLTDDGWLEVKVPTSKINGAINKLKKSNSVSIDAGEGITIILRNV